jgi:hypothetical protein
LTPRLTVVALLVSCRSKRSRPEEGFASSTAVDSTKSSVHDDAHHSGEAATAAETGTSADAAATCGDSRTAAQRAFEEIQRKRLREQAKKEASKSHKDKIKVSIVVVWS